MKKLILLLFFTISFHLQANDKILILGDSLTAGYGIEQSLAYPSELERLLKEKGHKYKVLNGGVSGSTTASGKSRLKWFLKSKPKIIIIALGANDGLRGIDLKQSQKNLEEVIQMSKKNGLVVFLAGMQLPPNYGKEYTSQFKLMFKELVKKFEINEIPFLLEGVAGVKELNIEDGIHPNSDGHKIMAKTVYKHLKEKL